MTEKLRKGRQVRRMRGGSRFLDLEEQRILVTVPEQEQQIRPRPDTPHADDAMGDIDNPVDRRPNVDHTAG